jgi:hypothetical protein
MSKWKDPFYVGYLPLPAAFRPFVNAFIAAGIVGLIVFATVLGAKQEDRGPGQWNTSQTFAIEGHLIAEPYPILYVSDSESDVGVRAVLLVSSLKFGANERAAAFSGKYVRAEGHFIALGGRAMFELVDGERALSLIDAGTPAPRVESLGQFTLTGEIMDSKCFLGVMKPGYGKTHRSCAVRCISGGIPPIFVTRDEAGAATIYLLTDADHRAVNQAVLPYVADSVELSGTLERHGDLLVYSIDPRRIARR